MPALGSGINANLGRIDYSPIARGGEAAARGIMGAGQAQAQGMASLGQGIAQGIQSFQKRQKENSILTGQIGAMAQQAGVGEFLDDKNKKLLEEFIDPEKELNNKKLSQLMASLSVASAENKKTQEYAQQAREFQLEIDKANAQREQANRSFGLQERSLNNDTARVQLERDRIALASMPEPPNLDSVERREQAGINAFIEQNVREPTAAEKLQILNEAAQVGVPQAPPSENAYGAGVGKNIADIHTKQFETAGIAEQRLPELYALRDRIENGDAEFGALADIRKTVDSFVADVFGSKEAASRATDAQLIEAATGSAVFGLIQSLGIGARGMDTPAERDFLIKVMTGRITLTKEALLELTDKTIRGEVSNIKSWNERTEDGTLDRFYGAGGIPKRIFTAPSYDDWVAENRSNNKTATGGADLGGGFTLN